MKANINVYKILILSLTSFLYAIELKEEEPIEHQKTLIESPQLPPFQTREINQPVSSLLPTSFIKEKEEATTIPFTSDESVQTLVPHELTHTKQQTLKTNE